MKELTRQTLRWGLLYMCFVALPVLGESTLVSSYDTELPLDPLSEKWEGLPLVTVNLMGQVVATPTLPDTSVQTITVRSINDGRAIVFWLSWEDSSEDRFHSIADFSDAVAIQVPYKPTAETPFMMGAPDHRVLILHWSAFRQENLDHGYFDTAKAYPNYAFDWYPHASSPYRYPEDWHNPYALNYVGGEKVYRKNVMRTPIREVAAEGFGTSTWKDIQGAEGNGVYKDGKWYVVIKRDFNEESTSNPTWGPGNDTFVTFAVWNGTNNERGARKALHYGWLPLRIETPR